MTLAVTTILGQIKLMSINNEGTLRTTVLKLHYQM